MKLAEIERTFLDSTEDFTNRSIRQSSFKPQVKLQKFTATPRRQNITKNKLHSSMSTNNVIG